MYHNEPAKFREASYYQKNHPRILVLNPPAPDESYINRDQMGGMGQKISFGKNIKSKMLSRLKGNFIHLPVSQLVYAATILSMRYDVRAIDAANDDKKIEDVIREVEAFVPDIVVMAVSTACVLYERDVVAGKIRKKIPKCTIITVGDTIPNMPELLKYPLDISIVGEAEKPLAEICEGRELKKINGIMYRKGREVIKNPRAAFLSGKELESLPFPKWELFNYRKFRYYPLIMHTPVAIMLSSRGCPYGCHYCSYSENMSTQWRARSAESVVNEMENDVKKYGFRGIVFRDPLFSLDAKRCEKICELIAERRLKCSWIFETRPELLSRNLLDKLKAAGCSGINFGIEDIHPEILGNVGRKPVSTDEIKEIVGYAEKIGIRTTCFFILGLPGSTKKSMEETIEFGFGLNPSHLEFKIATPYPGTKLYKAARKKGWIISEEFDKMGGYSSSMKIGGLPPEYIEELCDAAFKKFYMRRSYVLREISRGGLMKKFFVILKSMKR